MFIAKATHTHTHTHKYAEFLVTLSKIAKSDYAARHIRLSVCPNGTNRLPLEGFSRILISEYFSNICQEMLYVHQLMHLFISPREH